MSAYYNEWDSYCAAWLRNLIRAGLIAPGEVDERSITDVQPDDLKGFEQCHFFAGIAGWSLALRLAGWPDDRECWTGSCPCQPLSVAGKRLGHADQRHLWPAFFSLVSERRPAILFGEQVASKDGKEWLSAVRADLERIGYAIGAADLCPTAFGIEQERARLFFVADTAGPNTAGRHSPLRGVGRSREVDEDWGNADWRSSCEVGVLDDALPAGVAKAITRGFGNAISPPVAAQFISAVMELRP